MEKKKQKMLESRERFDKVLANHDLTNEESIETLVEKQLLRSTFTGSQGELSKLVQKRAVEVSNFLEMLRSASGNDKASLKPHRSSQNEWKLKQESDQLRVMYREGPYGTPFHSLLAEGFVDGPVDCSLCVSWESTLYKSWWPQYSIPTFKIISSSSLQKIRIGEEISLVRVKPPWPVSDREAILHNFELEFFKEDMIIVLLNTVPSTGHFNMSTHGFTNDGIPEADAVRIDVVGGFVIQKVSSNKSYFRGIANMDMKLEFMPPSLINFISRQLIGNGHKLYQKAVATVSSGDEEYKEALKGPMYARIREYLYSSGKSLIVEENVRDEKFTIQATEETTASSPQINAIGNTFVREIEEELVDPNPCFSGNQHTNGSTDVLPGQDRSEDGAFISPEVRRALGILDETIRIVRDLQSPTTSGNVSLPSPEMEEDHYLIEADSSRKVQGGRPLNVEGSPGIESPRHNGAVMHTTILKDADHGKQSAPQSPKQSPKQSPPTTGDVGDSKLSPGEKQPSVLERMSRVFDEVSINRNGGRHGSYGHGGHDLLEHQNKKKKRREWRRRQNCCLAFF